MPIDLVIDERDGGKPPELGGSTNGDGGTRSNADSTSHTDGASTPDVVSTTFFTCFCVPLVSDKCTTIDSFCVF